MYQIIEEDYCLDGVSYTAYGIGGRNVEIKDITCSKTEMEALVQLCNEETLAEIHLMDIVQDFLS